MERYDSYKDSGVEWIGEIPNHWSKIKLSMTINTTQGIQVDVPKQRYIKEEGYERFLRISDYTNPNIEHRFVNVPNLINYMVNEDDIVMFRYGESGKVVKGLKGVICNNVFSISSKKHEMSNNYLFEVFSSNDFYELLKSSSNNPTLSQVSHSQIKEQKVPFPPLSEQQQIVSFLDTKTSLIDSLIEKTQRKIELLKEKRTSIINEVVTKGLNPNVEMKNSGVEWIGEIPSHYQMISIKFLVTTPVSDGPHETPKFIDEGGIPFLSVEGVVGNKIDFEKVRGYISEELHEQYSKKCKPIRNDVLLVKSGSTTGKSTIVETDLEFNIWSPLCVIRSNTNKIIPRFTFQTFQSGYFRLLIENNWSYGTQPNIGMGVIENLRIVVPPIPEQQQIVEYLDEQTGLIEKIISIEVKRIELLKEYRQSLISEVVTGKRKVVEL